MNRLVAFVVLMATANVCSALAVVYMKHLSRAQYVETTEIQSNIDRLDVEWSQLKIEESTFSEHSLIEKVAHEKLEMSFPQLEEMVMIQR